jgi:hypothetical protein
MTSRELYLLHVREPRLQVYFGLVHKLSRLQPYLDLCWFAQALLKPGLARRKVSLPPRVARETQL